MQAVRYFYLRFNQIGEVFQNLQCKFSVSCEVLQKYYTQITLPFLEMQSFKFDINHLHAFASIITTEMLFSC